MGSLPGFNYIDGDVAYLLGLLAARGHLSDRDGVRRVVVEFHYRALQVSGTATTFDQQTAVRLGLNDVRERLLELLDADVSIVPRSAGVDLVVRFLRNNMVWRNLVMLTEGKADFVGLGLPDAIASPDAPRQVKLEFLRGFADVNGNIRRANRYVDGRNRVRLDVPNYPGNWELPVRLCSLLQVDLGVPVQNITWGHPSLGRKFREHQINVFVKPFARVGFSLPHKQRILEEFLQQDEASFPQAKYLPCRGGRPLDQVKSKGAVFESEKMDPRLQGYQFTSYAGICAALGCTQSHTEGATLFP